MSKQTKENKELEDRALEMIKNKDYSPGEINLFQDFFAAGFEAGMEYEKTEGWLNNQNKIKVVRRTKKII